MDVKAKAIPTIDNNVSELQLKFFCPRSIKMTPWNGMAKIPCNMFTISKFSRIVFCIVRNVFVLSMAISKHELARTVGIAAATLKDPIKLDAYMKTGV